MNFAKNNFGIRLRRLVEGRGTIESAYEKLGVSRATLFNWFERDEPPPGPLMLEKLRRYLGNAASELLDNLDVTGEHQAAYGQEVIRQHKIQSNQRPVASASPDPTDQQIVDYFLASLEVARRVPGGRGYVWSHLKMHLSPEQIKRLQE